METTNEILKEYAYPVICTLETLEENTSLIVKTLNERYPNNTIFIAGIGTSGAMIMTMVISKSNGKFLPMLFAKEQENSHRSKHCYNKRPAQTENPIIVVVDDLICSGNTLKTIRDGMNDVSNEYVSMVKVVSCAGSGHKAEVVQRIFPNTELFLV